MTSMLSLAYDWFFSALWIIESERNDEKVNVYRKMLWPSISGKVLELGPGYAQSLKFLKHTTLKDGSTSIDPAFIQSYTVLEPNTFLYNRLQKNAELNGFHVTYDTMSYPEGNAIVTMGGGDENVPFSIVKGTLDGDEIPQKVLDEAPYDSILTSFSLCTARNPEKSLENIFKLLRPGGTYYFIEHVRQPEPNDPLVIEDNGVSARFWGTVQDLINPVWKLVGHGCNINRRTGETVAKMGGWQTVDYKNVRPAIDLQSRIMPLSFGKATKPE
ncbi:hypothetical protein H4R99_006780 [Coemansia sp. RSA 1722]|nr:hypothetical protein LPJ57_002426 [Coemansia sp. RSA 486]KAJ2227729.1 hypothetical protein IWW45_006906 [Coemansia sp. RSA 485]KAJ2591364.1 hypothetical protein H4R99_006780 [Coemansia sp. RSA 1722]KAJ2635002.1 hypothetical protein GGF40_003866 [Coemansia sp. RSA 1286]